MIWIDNSMALLYDTIGKRYSDYRRSDARIAAAILSQIGQGKSIVNLGAGVGAYESNERNLIAVEPSRVMISQRPKSGATVVQGCAESLPFKDGAFDIEKGGTGGLKRKSRHRNRCGARTWT